MNLKTLTMASTGLVVVAAVVLGFSWLRTTSGKGRLGQPLLAGTDFSALRQIQILSAEHTVHLVKKEGLWQVREQSDFHADANKIGRMLLELTRQKPEHLVTERPDKLPDLGLLSVKEAKERQGKAMPKGAKAKDSGDATSENTLEGVGIELALIDDKGKVVFHLITGEDRVTTIRGRPAFGGQYVRLNKENAAFLIGKNINPDTSPTAWLASSLHSTVYTEGGDSLRKVSSAVRIQIPQKPPLRIYRKSTTSPWQVEGLRLEQQNDTEINDLLNQVFGLEIESVLKKGTLRLPESQRASVQIETFDGQRYEYRVNTKPDQDLHTIGFSARYDASLINAQALAKTKPNKEAPSAQQKVKEFKQKWEGRVFTLLKWNYMRLDKVENDLRKQKPQSQANKL